MGMDCVNIQMYESSRERGEEKGNSADLQQYCGCGLAVTCEDAVTTIHG